MKTASAQDIVSGISALEWWRLSLMDLEVTESLFMVSKKAEFKSAGTRA